MKILATVDGTASIFDSWRQFIAATFPPHCTIADVILLQLNGRTYAERRKSLQIIVHEIQSADNGGMSYGELAYLNAWIERNARRYGLLTEFRDNGII